MQVRSTRRRSRVAPLLGSALVHALVLVGALALRARPTAAPRSAAPRVDALEIALLHRVEPAPAATAPERDTRLAHAAAATRPTPSPAHTHSPRRAPRPRTAASAPEPPAAATPAPSVAPSASPPHLSAADLFAPVNPNAVPGALVDLASPAPAHAGRAALFGRPGGRPDAAAVARAPTDAHLGGAEHGQPAGTMRHDRTAARRAAEQLFPLLARPEVAAAVMRAPVRPRPFLVHIPPAGAAAINTEAAFTASVLPPVLWGGHSTCPDPHVLVTEIEVEQDASEAITAARVARSSGRRVIDDTALAAIRDGIVRVPRIGAGQARRSRWRIEIADRPTASRVVCTEGWMLLSYAPVGGVHLMLRVMRARD